MTNKINDLFGEKPKRVRAKRRVMAHLVDGGADFVRFECKCGWDSDWLNISDYDFKEIHFRCGIPCGVCNE